MTSLPLCVFKEFRASAIPDRLTLANVQWIEGEAAVQMMAETAIAKVQRNASYLTQSSKRILEKYQFAAAGGWVVYGSEVDGSAATVPYFKPVTPRRELDNGKIKTIKYETAQGCEALPILPNVPWVDGWRIAKRAGLKSEYEQRIREAIGEDFSEPTLESVLERAESLPSGNFGYGGGGGSGVSNFPVAGFERGGIAADHSRSQGNFGDSFASRNSSQTEETWLNFLQSRDKFFWRWLQIHTELPVVITEGVKKALSLVAQGLPAMALRGITCWHKKGSLELHEVLGQFAKAGRSIYIVFDQDEKTSTQRDVRIQLLKLGNTLEAMGCKGVVPIWDGNLGKGIDDALAAQGAKAQAWFDNLLKEAPSLNDYKRHGRIAAALAAIDRLNQLSYPIERQTEGEYLPELPPLQRGMVHAILAMMNAGKTTRIGVDWVKAAIEVGWNVLVLNPLNALGKQTAKDWGLPHINDDKGIDAVSTRRLWELVKEKRGIVLCPDSLSKIPIWFWDRPTLLILDEANQVIEHLCEGNTLGSRQSDILLEFSEAAYHAIQSGAIVLSEDGLPDRAVKFIETITDCGTDKVRVFRHKKQGTPWNCTVFSGQASGYRARLLEAIKNGDRLLVVTSSQREAKRLQRAIGKTEPGRVVVRIDSETNQQGQFNSFFAAPDTWLKLKQPDVLILSPSAKSGVSIEGSISTEDAYFSSVWGYFPALATDTHMQLLGRYRPPVPRLIFAPPFISTGGDEGLFTPRAVKRRLHSNLRGIAGAFGLNDLLEAEGDRAESLVRIETAVLNYVAESRTVSGAQKSIAHDALVKRLEAAGHTVICEKIGKDAGKIKLWKQVQEEIWREEAKAIATAKVEPIHTLSWAHKTLDSLEATLEARTLAQKVLWREEFPGVSFDDAEECYQALCLDYGAMRRGVLMQGKAENLEAAKEADRAGVEAILKSPIRSAHKLPRSYLRAVLIAKTDVLELLNGKAYSNSDSRAIAVKKMALQWANEISYWLRLQIKPEQTPVEVCNKLLKKLGLEGAAIARPGRRGEERDRVYQVSGLDNPIRMRLLEAIRRKLSGSVSVICNMGILPITQIVDTPPPPPISPSSKEKGWQVGELCRWKTSLSDWVVAAVEGSIAHIQQIQGWASGTVFQADIEELREAAS